MSFHIIFWTYSEKISLLRIYLMFPPNGPGLDMCALKVSFCLVLEQDKCSINRYLKLR